MESIDRDLVPAEELLKELAELRELDRQRHAHAPGSPARDAASTELDARGRRLMDRFRDALANDMRADGASPPRTGVQRVH